MANRCESCSRKCCVDFGLTRELTDPVGLNEELGNFPFIRKTGSKLVIGPGGYERTVGIYNCGRYELEAGKCRDYETEPRPKFCHNTGEKFTPHPDCLWRAKNDQKG